MAILTVNSGSSSLKLALYSVDGQECLLSASATSIGKADGALVINGPDGKPVLDERVRFAHQHDAFDLAYREMQQRQPDTVTAIGHRVVHGGPHLVRHQCIDDAVLQQLREAVHFAPLHIPPAIDLIEYTQASVPAALQVACFDTAFHQTMPPEAFTYALPKKYRDAGVRRFGFHGLSYESIVHTMGNSLPRRTVIAHLGSGASACALLDGESQDTSMGLSPTGGFPMATRPGDLDPGVVLLLERDLSGKLPALQPDELETVLNHESGLQGLADESDIRELLKRSSAGDAGAGLALKIFYREIAKTIGSYFVVLGGIDLIVFTGGIGEHSAPVREGVCGHLKSLGILIDAGENNANSPERISSRASKTIRIMPADENGQIARHVAAIAGAYGVGSPLLNSLIASR